MYRCLVQVSGRGICVQVLSTDIGKQESSMSVGVQVYMYRYLV